VKRKKKKKPERRNIGTQCVATSNSPLYTRATCYVTSLGDQLGRMHANVIRQLHLIKTVCTPSNQLTFKPYTLF